MRYTLPPSHGAPSPGRDEERADREHGMVTARRTTPDVQHEEIVPEEATGALAETAPTRALVGTRPRPSFGPEFWILGVAASLPALLGALALLACAGLLPLVPELPVG